jgi:FkbM family methyltransferase
LQETIVLHWIMKKCGFKVVPMRKFPKANQFACLSKIAALGLEPKHIIDVGANKGSWSRVAAQVFPRCQYTLIEPQIEMKRRLDRFCRRRNATWLLAGVSDEKGKLLFTPLPDTVSSTFVITTEQAKARGLKQRVIPVTTLNDLVDEIGAIPEIVKIDAEGFEAKIIRGAGNLLGATELFFLEAHLLEPGEHPCGFVETVAMMSDLGYVPFDFTWFGRLRSPNAIDLCEISFARRDGVLRKRAIYHPENRAA